MERPVATVAVVAVLLLAGCTGGGTTTFAASQGTVSGAAQSETGYERSRATTETVERTFAGVDVEAENQLVEYKRTVDTPLGSQEVARFVVYTTPQVEVGGAGPFNPVGDLSNRELAQRLSEKFDRVEDPRFVGNRTTASLGEQRTVSTFEATAQVAGGQSIDVLVHVAKFPHGEDYVIAVAIHPQLIDEEGRVDTLLGGIEHPAG